MTLNRATAGPAALKRGLTQEGVPYIWGAEDPGVGFDCDGLYRFCWNPLLAAIKAHQLLGNTFTNYTEYVFDERNGHRNDPCQPGDGLFITGSDGSGGEPGHVMIYDSPGQVLQAEMTGTLIGVYPFDTDNGWQYRCRPSLAFPSPPPPNPPNPTAADLMHAGLVQLNEPMCLTARANGWPVWRWSQGKGWFVNYGNPVPPLPDFPIFASRNWEVERPS